MTNSRLKVQVAARSGGAIPESSLGSNASNTAWVAVGDAPGFEVLSGLHLGSFCRTTRDTREPMTDVFHDGIGRRDLRWPLDNGFPEKFTCEILISRQC